MSERTPAELLMGAIDGDPGSLELVQARPELAAELARWHAQRARLRSEPVEVPASVREANIAAALGVFDEMAAKRVVPPTTASTPSPTNVVPLAGRRARRRLPGMAVGAAAAAVIGILVVGNLNNDQSVNDTAESTQAESVNTTALPSQAAPAEAISTQPTSDDARVTSGLADTAPEADGDAAAPSEAITAAVLVAEFGPLDERFLECEELLDLPGRPWTESATLPGTLDDTVSIRVKDDTGAIYEFAFEPGTCAVLGSPNVIAP